MTGSLLVLLQSLLFQISFPRLGHLSTVGMQSSRSFSVTLYIKLYVPITGIVYFSETCYFHQMPFRDLRKSVHLDSLFLKINQLHSSTSIITTEGKCDLMNGKIQELQQHCPEFSFLIFVFFFPWVASFSDNLTLCGSKYVNEQFHTYILSTLQPLSQYQQKCGSGSCFTSLGPVSILDPVTVVLWVIYTDQSSLGHMPSCEAGSA